MVILYEIVMESNYLQDYLKNSRIFYSSDKINNRDIGLSVALGDSLNYINGIVLTIPELIETIVPMNRHSKDNDLLRNWHHGHTEENIGIDKYGYFYNKGEPILMIVNGGGLLTPDRISRAYDQGLVNGSVRYSDKEWDNFLKKIAGSGLPIYKIEDILTNEKLLPHRNIIVMPYSDVRGRDSNKLFLDKFIADKLVIARNGGLRNLKEYYDIMSSREGVGNFHPYYDDKINPKIPQGRMLYLGEFDSGFNCLGVDSQGRFAVIKKEINDQIY